MLDNYTVNVNDYFTESNIGMSQNENKNLDTSIDLFTDSDQSFETRSNSDDKHSCKSLSIVNETTNTCQVKTGNEKGG